MIGPSAEVDDGGLIVWVNGSYLQIVDEIAKVNPDYFAKSATADTVSGQQEYALPDDFERVLMVNIQREGTWYRSKPLPNVTDVVVHSDTASNQGYSWGDPRYYILGSTIGFLPIPDEAGNETIKLWYVYTPAEMDEDTDEPAFPKKFHHLIKYGAYANYLDQDDEHVAAENMRRRFDKRLLDMIEGMSQNQLDETRSVQVTSDGDLYHDQNDW